MSDSLTQAPLARELIKSAVLHMAQAGMPASGHEAEWLLSRLTATERVELYVQSQPLSPSLVRRFWDCIEQRLAGKPIQYLVGQADFFGQRLKVASGVFIPRPETEVVVDYMLQALQGTFGRKQRLNLVEFGVGSGCISAALAQHLPACSIIGIEVSYEALCVAQENLGRLGLLDRVHLIQSSWDTALQGRFHGVIANPPYIPSLEVDRLPLDVRYEPRLSLDGGPDGMRDLLQLIAQAPNWLMPGAWLVLECAEDQVAKLIDQCRAQTWVAQVMPITDLAKRPRGVCVQA